MSELKVDEVIEKLRPSFATIIQIIEECLVFNREKNYYIDTDYKIADYTPLPLGVVIVHLKSHLEGDERVHFAKPEARLYEPSVLEMKKFYRSPLDIMAVCAKEGTNYWMYLFTKIRVARGGVTCDSKVINLRCK